MKLARIFVTGLYGRKGPCWDRKIGKTKVIEIFYGIFAYSKRLESRGNGVSEPGRMVYYQKAEPSGAGNGMDYPPH
jgi:hypothetical protein